MPKKFLSLFLLISGLLLLTPLSLAANVQDVRMWRSPDNTRVVFDLDAAVEHKVFVLQDPARVVVDITQTTMNTNIAPVDWQGTPVRSMRTGIHDKNILRVVFDLATAVNPKSFLLKKMIF